MSLNPADVGQRLSLIVPGQEIITLFLRQPAPPDDVFKKYVLVGARGRPSKQNVISPDGIVLPPTHKTWHLYRPVLIAAGVPVNTSSESYDYLLDQSGQKWVVQSVDVKSNWSFVILDTVKGV